MREMNPGIANGFSSGQYIFTKGTLSIGAILLITWFNLIAVLAALASYWLLSRIYPLLRLIPAIAGYAFLAIAHYYLNLASDAQASIALVFIPIYAAFATGTATILLLILRFLWHRFRKTENPPLFSETTRHKLENFQRGLTIKEYIICGLLFFLGGVFASICSAICMYLLQKRSHFIRQLPAYAGLAVQLIQYVVTVVTFPPSLFVTLPPFPTLAVWLAYAGIRLYERRRTR